MFTFKKDEIGICERDMLKGFKLIYFQVQRYIVILLGSVCNIISLCKIEFGHIIHDFFLIMCRTLPRKAVRKCNLAGFETEKS